MRELDVEVLPDGLLRYAYIDECNPSSNREGQTREWDGIGYLATQS